MLKILAQSPIIKTPNSRAYRWCLAAVLNDNDKRTQEFLLYHLYYIYLDGKFIEDERGDGTYYPIDYNKGISSIDVAFQLAFEKWTQRCLGLSILYEECLRNNGGETFVVLNATN